MPETVIQSYSPVVAGVNSDSDVVLVLVLAARREGEDGERLSLTPRQKESAMNAAAASLEIIDGTVVNPNSTGFVVPIPTLSEGETLTLRIHADLVASDEAQE